MAESLDRTIDKGCEEYYEFNCSICLSQKSACTEAAYYCPECNIYFCKTCLGLSECDHNVLGRGSVDQWGHSVNPSQFDRCPRHKRNEVQLYCPRHDVVCCAICSQTEHKKCDDLKYIPLIASAVENTANKKVVNNGIRQLKAEVDQLKKNRSPVVATIDEVSSQLIREVKESRAKIDALLDSQEETSIEEIRKWQTDLTDRVKSELSICDNIEADMVDLESKLSKSRTNEPLLFARLKQGREMVSDKIGLVSDMLGSKIADTAQFEVYKDFIETLETRQGLGQLVTGETVVLAHSLNRGLGTGQAFERKDGHGQSHQKPKLNVPYKWKNIRYINGKMRGDGNCDIWSMLQLPDGSVILVDNKNKCLKLLDRSYNATSRCILPFEPRGVCQIDQDNLAVTMSNKTIQFVSVGQNMILGRSFSTGHDCNGLTCINKSLYVTEYRGPNVFVYDLTGSLMRTINADQNRKPMFQNTKYITPSPDYKTLFVTDWERGLITLDPKGRLLATLSSPAISKACDVCVDEVGNVFLCDFASQSITQISDSGVQKLASIYTHWHGPQAICFDKINSCILVASRCNNDLKCYHMCQ